MVHVGNGITKNAVPSNDDFMAYKEGLEKEKWICLNCPGHVDKEYEPETFVTTDHLKWFKFEIVLKINNYSEIMDRKYNILKNGIVYMEGRTISCENSYIVLNKKLLIDLRILHLYVL